MRGAVEGFWPRHFAVVAIRSEERLQSLRSVVFERKGRGTLGPSCGPAREEPFLLREPVPVRFLQTSPPRRDLTKDKLWLPARNCTVVSHSFAHLFSSLIDNWSQD